MWNSIDEFIKQINERLGSSPSYLLGSKFCWQHGRQSFLNITFYVNHCDLVFKKNGELVFNERINYKKYSPIAFGDKVLAKILE